MLIKKKWESSTRYIIIILTTNLENHYFWVGISVYHMVHRSHPHPLPSAMLLAVIANHEASPATPSGWTVAAWSHRVQLAGTVGAWHTPSHHPDFSPTISLGQKPAITSWYEKYLKYSVLSILSVAGFCASTGPRPRSQEKNSMVPWLNIGGATFGQISANSKTGWQLAPCWLCFRDSAWSCQAKDES